MRRHALGACLLLALFVGLALASRSGPLPGDAWLSHAWASSNQAVAVVNFVASIQVWTVLVLVTGACLWMSGLRSSVILLALADLTGEALAFMAKAIVLRPRPSDTPLADALATASFPSGHVMRVTVSLGVLLLLFAWQRPAWRWPCTGLVCVAVLMVGAARIASGEHWPTDVLAGYLLAGAWGEILLIGVARFGQRGARI